MNTIDRSAPLRLHECKAFGVGALIKFLHIEEVQFSLKIAITMLIQHNHLMHEAGNTLLSAIGP